RGWSRWCRGGVGFFANAREAALLREIAIDRPRSDITQVVKPAARRPWRSRVAQLRCIFAAGHLYRAHERTCRGGYVTSSLPAASRAVQCRGGVFARRV